MEERIRDIEKALVDIMNLRDVDKEVRSRIEDKVGYKRVIFWKDVDNGTIDKRTN
jgi:hypothetical protein